MHADLRQISCKTLPGPDVEGNSSPTPSTSFFLKKFCSETNRFTRFALRENDPAHPKTAADQKDLLSFSKHFRTPITRITRKPLSGSVILILNPSLQTKLTDDYAARNIDADKCRGKSAASIKKVDERYRLVTAKEIGFMEPQSIPL
jgi:hypothetical protein